MKKVIVGFIILAVLFSFASASSLYAKTGRIVRINELTNTVSFVDGEGMIWTFGDIADFEVGELVSVLMWDADTKDFEFDDEIVDVEHAGEL